jgi:glycine cleavage system H protein
MNIDPHARYLPSHEWARPEGEFYVCGISDHAQDALGDVVYVDLPPVGTVFAKDAVFGVVESVKAANDLYAPVSGEIVAINDALNQHPEAVNQDPYGAGWMVRIRPSQPSEWETLLDAQAYGKLS